MGPLCSHIVLMQVFRIAHIMSEIKEDIDLGEEHLLWEGYFLGLPTIIERFLSIFFSNQKIVLM